MFSESTQEILDHAWEVLKADWHIELFHETAITISFPQRDVHFDTLKPLVNQSREAFSRVASKVNLPISNCTYGFPRLLIRLHSSTR